MKLLLVCALVASIFVLRTRADAAGKVVCYYDSKSFIREGLGKVSVTDIEPALSFCTHLIYGYAEINEQTHKLESANPSLDLDQGKAHYRVITALKKRYPMLKILLSVGGDSLHTEKYLTLLESTTGKLAFINSAYALIKNYEFDGLDLAWEFPVVKPKKIRGTVSSFFHKLKKPFVGDAVVDEKWEEHREQFTAFVRELKNSFRHDGYLLTTTVLPNVNSSLYYDIPAIVNNLDFVVLGTFDFQTFERNPKEADFPAPLYELNERNPESNINYQVQYWLTGRCPASKIVIGIPTYGRAWKMIEDSGITGVPPLRTDKEGIIEGIQTKTPGLLSWPEVCSKLPNPGNMHLKGEDAPLRKVGDPTKRFGSYAYRLPDNDGNFGMWVGYEDPDTAGNKAGYVRAKGLGGIGIFDLSLDDFRGSCTGDKFPILRAAKYRL